MLWLQGLHALISIASFGVPSERLFALTLSILKKPFVDVMDSSYFSNITTWAHLESHQLQLERDYTALESVLVNFTLRVLTQRTPSIYHQLIFSISLG